MAIYKTYIWVWISLLVLTAVTVAVSYVPMGIFNATVALIIASIKAALVAGYFMHLRHETKLVLGFAVFPLMVLALLILGTLIDTYFR